MERRRRHVSYFNSDNIFFSVLSSFSQVLDQLHQTIPNCVKTIQARQNQIVQNETFKLRELGYEIGN